MADALADARLAVAAARLAVEDARIQLGTIIAKHDTLKIRAGIPLMSAQETQGIAALIAEVENTEQPEAKQRQDEAEAAHEAARAAYDAAARDAEPVWEDAGDRPVLLLPLRLETVYRDVEGVAQLWIRAYPDDVHVDGHEPELTAGEREAAEAYAAAVAAAPGDDEDDRDTRAAVWGALVAALGAGRAAWAVEALRREAEGAPALPARDATWTRAARAALLPERLIFSGYRLGRLRWRVTGEPIPATVDVGLAPPDRVADGDADADPDRRGPWHGDAAWLVDFRAAVERGLGVRVTLTEPDVGYDLITVLGVVREDATAALEELLEAHAYTDGLDLLPVDTPTNNTPESRSGWHSRRDPLSPEEAARQREALTPADPVARLARALGVDPARSLAVAPDARHDNGEAVTVPVTRLVGHVLAMSGDWMAPGSAWPDLTALQAHMVTFVRGRGPLPTLRVGRQPYGVLPATALDLWRGGSETQEAIALVGSSIATAFGERLQRAPRVGVGPDPTATVLDILSRRPASRRVTAVDNAVFGDGPKPPYPIGALDQSVPFAFRWPQVAGKEISAADPPSPALAALVAARPLTRFSEVLDEMVAIVRAADPAGEQPDVTSLDGRFKAYGLALKPALKSGESGLFLPLVAGFLQMAFIFTYMSEWVERKRAAGLLTEEPPASSVSLLALAAPLEAIRRDTIVVEELAAADLGAVERTLCEVLDLASHRVDAWVTSLATSRLEELRAAAPTGLRAGAYGFVHDVHPQEPRAQAGSDGYIVAPSLHHATTAAVLRSGWQVAKDPGAFAVDLRSTRVRKALTLLDGARSGQPLGALLGYRFERALHEHGLERHVSALRATFPLAPQVDLGEHDDGTAGAARAAVGARDVVDGQAVRVALAGGVPDALDLGDDTEAVVALVAELNDTVDALSDLLLAESVHHLVGGNPLRAGLSADAIGRGEGVPQEFDVLTTPRAARLVPFAAGVLVPDEGDGDGWAATPLAALEPGLEAWCAAQLGPAAGWRVTAAPGAPEVGVDALGVSALEVVLGAGPGGALARRLARAVGVDDADPEAASAAGDPRLAELLALAARLRQALASAVALDASHLDPIAGRGLAVADLDGVADRVAVWEATVAPAAAALRAAADDHARATALDALADAGVVDAARAGDVDDLAARATAVAARLDGAAALPLPAPPSDEDRTAHAATQWLAAATARTRAVVGDALLLLPRLNLAGTEAGRTLGTANRPVGADEDALADLVRELGGVRPAVRALGDALLGAEVVAGAAPPAWVAAQSPAAAGVALVATAASPARSCALLASAGAVDADRPAGFVCDQWVEALPDGDADEVAAIAFHHARPDARAPHALLIAVPPDPERGWRMEDLHAIVDDTYRLARLRTLDLDDLPDLRGLLPPDLWLAGTEPL